MSKEQIDQLIIILKELLLDEFEDTSKLVVSDINDVIYHMQRLLTKQVNKSQKINNIIEHLIDYSNGDFSRKLEISEDEDQLDVISMGLNTFVEELRENAVSIETFDAVFKSISSPFL